MNISVSVKLDSLLRDLRLTGHALAETAERQVLRAVRRGSEALRQPGRVGKSEREREQP